MCVSDFTKFVVRFLMALIAVCSASAYCQTVLPTLAAFKFHPVIATDYRVPKMGNTGNQYSSPFTLPRYGTVCQIVNMQPCPTIITVLFQLTS